jgi:hypothetical protein
MFTKKRKKEKNELSKEDSQKYIHYGEDFAKKLKIGETISKINRYGSKNPIRTFIIIFLMILSGFTISFLMPNPDFEAKVKPNDTKIGVNPNSEEAFKQEIINIYNEMQAISDSMANVISKDNLTREDSIFLVKKYTRLQQLDTILNKEYNDK